MACTILMPSIFHDSPDAAALCEAYRAVRDLSEQLADPLSPEDQTVQSMSNASPTKWHLAHTTWFFETFVLAEHAPGYARFNDDYAYLFNSYYNGVGAQYSRTDRGKITRPGAAEVRDYRAHVDGAMTELMEHASGNAAGRIAELVTLGLNHEQQHQELLITDIKHAFSFNPMNPVYHDRIADTGEASTLKWIEFEGGRVIALADQTMDRREFGRGYSPILQRGLQRRRDIRHFRRPAKVVRHHDQRAVATTGFERPELHAATSGLVRLRR